MQNFQYQIPTKLLFGENCINSLPFLLEKFGRNILLVYGCGSIKRIGLYDRLKELLSDFEITEYAGVHPNPEYAEDVLPGIQLGLNRDIDVVLAVGGGSVLDCAKTIAAGVCYEGDVWDLISYKRPVKAALPIVTVVTTASSGSEYDNGAVISRIETASRIATFGMKVFELGSDLGSEALSEAGDDFLQSLAKETIDTLHHFFLSLGLQMKLTDLPMIREAGLNEEKLQEMARRCIKTTGISAAHSYAPLDEADVLAIMKACL